MVITLDKRKKPLVFCSERRARILLEKSRACVYRYYPFTIIIKDVDVRALPDDAQLKDYRIKIDPGSKHTGMSIVSVEYQQGELFGYEVKEYLLDKFGHTCQYCGGTSGNSVLEWEHIQPRSKGGSDSVKNATLSCKCCNQAKSNLKLEDWRSKEITISKDVHSSAVRRKLAETRVNGINAVLKNKPIHISNRYCAWANASRKYVEKELYSVFGNVECSSGGRTKFNRTKLGLPKDHHYDALCVGEVPEDGYRDLTNGYCLYIKAVGRGFRFRGKINKCGVITLKLKRSPKRRFGFQNGDIVLADVPKGKHAGYHVGRVMTRQTGYFDIRKTDGSLVTANHQYCRIFQRDNGY